MQKLGSYLERVLNWEEFGYQLLPEDKEYLVQVYATMHSTQHISNFRKILILRIFMLSSIILYM